MPRGRSSASAAGLTCLLSDAIKTVMTTITVTDARQKLGYWLRRAERGENIGVFLGNKVIAFRPVSVVSTDYAEIEYGLTPAEVDAAAARIAAETKSAQTVPYIPGMLSGANRTDKTFPRRGKKAQRR